MALKQMAQGRNGSQSSQNERDLRYEVGVRRKGLKKSQEQLVKELVADTGNYVGLWVGNLKPQRYRI